jgi:hypothetical protein
MDRMGSPHGVEGISRRRALKRIGAGAAIAWSAPIITTMRTSAFAQSAPPECLRCIPYDCNNPSFCPQPCFSFCVQRINDACSCSPLIAWHLNGFNLPPICESDAECDGETGPGSVCINMNANCDAVDNKGCAAPCGGREIRARRGLKVRQV